LKRNDCGLRIEGDLSKMISFQSLAIRCVVSWQTPAMPGRFATRNQIPSLQAFIFTPDSISQQ
jgi:hypothetical protein